jgi:hypothetical protein
MSSKPDSPAVVGWREFAALPEWNIRRIKAKIDTGARTSALHVGRLEELPDGRVRFEVVVRETPALRTRIVEARPVRRTTVKSSSGERQERLVFRTRLVIGPLERDIELSVVSREGMLCRMLVGRKALPVGVLVDPAHKYLHGGVRNRRTPQEDTR